MTLAALEPWEPSADVVLRSPAEHRARRAGATFATRGGWSVATAVPGEEAHLAAVAFADATHLAKLEVRGGEGSLELFVHVGAADLALDPALDASPASSHTTLTAKDG